MSIRTRIFTICMAFALMTSLVGMVMFQMEHRVGRIALAMYDDSFMSINFFRKAEVVFAELRVTFGASHDRLAASRSELLSSLIADLEISIDRATSARSRGIATSLKSRVESVTMAGDDPALVLRNLDSIAPAFASGAEEFAQDGFERRMRVETLNRSSDFVCAVAVILSLALTFVATILFSKAIVLPIERLTKVAAAIADGDLDNDIDTIGRSEVAQLGRALSYMQHRLQTGRVQAQRIEHMAHHDVLTDLANRAAFSARMDAAIDIARHGCQFSLLLLDLDRFKAVNDTLGHGAGDALLRIVAARLHNCVRSDDVIARLGGDEFAILQPNGHAEEAEILAARVVNVLSEPYEIDGQLVSIGTSVGIALSNPDSMADDLRKNADLALYASKAAGRGTWRFFDDDLLASRLSAPLMSFASPRLVVSPG